MMGGSVQTTMSDPWGTIEVGPFANYVKLITGVVGVMLVLLAWPTNRDATGSPSLDFGKDAGEFYALMLLSLAGLLLVLAGGAMWWRQSRTEAAILSAEDRALLAMTAPPPGHMPSFDEAAAPFEPMDLGSRVVLGAASAVVLLFWLIPGPLVGAAGEAARSLF